MDDMPHILLVDDDKTLLMLGERALENAHFRITTASDGEAALKSFVEHKPDIILLDVVLPKFDGFTICSRIRLLPNGGNVPILMMTGLNDLSSIDKAYRHGATDFVTKPINWTILCHRLQYIHRGSQAMNQLYTTMETLRSSEKRLSKAQKLARLGHWEFSPHSKKIIYSDMIGEIFEFANTNNTIDISSIYQYIHPDDISKAVEMVRASFNQRTNSHIEVRITTSNGNERIVALELDCSDTRANHVIHGVIQDMTERRATEHTIQRLAYYDKNTELHNQHFFAENAPAVLQTIKSKGLTGAVLHLGVSNLGKITQYLNPERLNRFYRNLGENLKVILGDMPSTNSTESLHELNPCVVGDGVFAIILANISSKMNLLSDIENILNLANKKIVVDDQELLPSIRIGVSIYPDYGTDIITLMKNADVALNQITGFGKSYQLYSRYKHEQTAQYVTIENRLRAAIEQDLLTAHYQPKYSLKRHSICGTELLCRWHDPELGTVSPDEFIPIAEESGLIIPLGEWVIRTACMQANRWQKSGLRDFSIAINLSAHNFWDKNLISYIEQQISLHGISGEYLDFEITERTLLNDIDEAVTTLNAIRDLGAALSIDDFGTGYSSLGYLMRLPINTLKIDRSFICDIETSRDSHSITKAIIALAHNLSLKVVAEGVETTEQLKILEDMQCDEIQGFLISRAVPPDELLKQMLPGRTQ